MRMRTTAQFISSIPMASMWGIGSKTNSSKDGVCYHMVFTNGSAAVGISQFWTQGWHRTLC
jgi:hypothetical protein